VAHNGVVIHEKGKLPKKTTAAPNNEGPEPGFVYLQNHGNEVRYRNIWAVRMDLEKASGASESESETNQDCVLELNREQEGRQSNENYKAQIEMDMNYALYLPAEYEKKKIGH